MACVYVYVIVLTVIGPEMRHRAFGIAQDGDLAEATGHHVIQSVMRGNTTVEAGR